MISNEEHYIKILEFDLGNKKLTVKKEYFIHDSF